MADSHRVFQKGGAVFPPSLAAIAPSNANGRAASRTWELLLLHCPFAFRLRKRWGLDWLLPTGSAGLGCLLSLASLVLLPRLFSCIGPSGQTGCSYWLGWLGCLLPLALLAAPTGSTGSTCCSNWLHRRLASTGSTGLAGCSVGAAAALVASQAVALVALAASAAAAAAALVAALAAALVAPLAKTKTGPYFGDLR